MNIIKDISVLEEGKKINIIYGLAGDPPHYGHLKAIKYLLSISNSTVWIVLSASHAFGKKMAPYSIRRKWLNALIFGKNSILTDKEKNRIIIKDIENEIILASNQSNKVVYSIDLKIYFEEKYKNKTFVWAFGNDNTSIEGISKFKEYQKLIEWPIVEIPEFMHVRSTQVRDALKKGDKVFLFEKIGIDLTHKILKWLDHKEGENWLINRI